MNQEKDVTTETKETEDRPEEKSSSGDDDKVEKGPEANIEQRKEAGKEESPEKKEEPPQNRDGGPDPEEEKQAPIGKETGETSQEGSTKSNATSEDDGKEPDIKKEGDTSKGDKPAPPLKKEEKVKKEDKEESKKGSGPDKGPEEKEGGRSEVEKKTKEAEEEEEKIVFEPITDDGKDLLKDMEIPSREEMVIKIVDKHKGLVSKYKKELEELDRSPKEVVEESDEEKAIRDRINQEVASLKEKRTALKEENKKLRREFFDLIGKEERVKEHEKDVNMHQDFIKDLEWKLNTEAIDIGTERRLMDQLKSTIGELRSLTDGLTPEEIKVRLTEIQEEIGENLVNIEDLHSRMLEKVNESNLHHEKFVDAQKKVREKESRKGWLERRIKLHEEMGIFWEGQSDQAKKMDQEESKRSVEGIRDALVKLFEERDGEKPGEDEERKGKRSGPRKKLEIKDRKGGSEPKEKNKSEPSGEPQKKEGQKEEKPERSEPSGEPQKKEGQKEEKAERSEPSGEPKQKEGSMKGSESEKKDTVKKEEGPKKEEEGEGPKSSSSENDKKQKVPQDDEQGSKEVV